MTPRERMDRLTVIERKLDALMAGAQTAAAVARYQAGLPLRCRDAAAVMGVRPASLSVLVGRCELGRLRPGWYAAEHVRTWLDTKRADRPGRASPPAHGRLHFTPPDSRDGVSAVPPARPGRVAGSGTPGGCR